MKITRRLAELDATDIGYLDAGSGDLAFLVHGFPLDARMWLDQLWNLGGEGRRVVAPDLRGHGGSPWAGDTVHAMDTLAADVVALADHLGADRFDLVGLSMGGYVALAVAAAAPGRLRSLGLVDTKAGPDTAEGRTGRDAMAESVVVEGRGWLHEKLSAVLLGGGASNVVRARVRTMIETQTYESIVADLAGMRDRPDRTGTLRFLDLPAAVIVGSEDAITPPSASREMADRLPDADLTVVDGAGHMSPMEDPEAVNQALAALWDRAGDTV